MSKLNVGVVFGGVSSEHEISLLSATSVIENLDHEKYNIYYIGITKEGLWLHYTGAVSAIRDGSWQTKEDQLTRACILPDATVQGLARFGKDGVEFIRLDAVFGVLHGKNGEDGTIQGLFELANIPYAGCDVLSSAMCMDKAITHTVLGNAGVRMAKWAQVMVYEIDQFDVVEQKLLKTLGYPMFVKPANAGSSVGVNKAKNKEQLHEALNEAFLHDRKVIVEEFIQGSEVETAVLGNDDPIAAVVGEIVPKQEFYTYSAKYQDDATDLYIPARIPQQASEQVREVALKAYRALGCTGLSRVDFFYQPKTGAVILNEINTIPGFTSISMYPKLFEAYGIPYTQLLDRILQYAIERKAKTQ